MTIKILELGTDKEMIFAAKNAMDAMEKALYYLNLSNFDKDAKICYCGKNNRTLTLEHSGKTFSTLADSTF